MRHTISYSFRITLLFLVGFLSETVALYAQNVPSSPKVPVDTTHYRLLYPFRNYTGIPYLDTIQPSPFYLKTPPNIKKEIIYNPVTNSYEFISKVGNFEYRTPSVLNFREYRKLDSTRSVNNYWQQRALSRGTAVGTQLIPKIYIRSRAFQQIFGSNSIDIRPQGTAQISMGVLSNYRDDPTLDVNQLHTTNFDFNEKIQMNVNARIGDKLSFKANYNTESSFNFENTLKLRYVGKKNDIVKSIEAGNVSMPLQSTLITGAQSLFGVKTKLQFGKTTVTAVFSQQQSQTQNITIQNGSEQNTFKMTSLDYDSNRHFFLSQYFRDHYAQALKTLPIVTSDINITKIEVWVTNIGPATSQNRNIVAFTDLGEGQASEIYNPNVKPTPGNTFPTNQANDLLSRMDTTQLRNINTVTSYLTGDPLHIGKTGYFTPGEDFVKLENARLLSPSEYTVNTKLGFITLNTALNSDQVLAVAFQYTVIGHNGVYQVGEFSDQGINSPKDLIVKLLKSNTLNTHMPMWKLMMKNVYSIGAYQVQPQDFVFNILYSGNPQGVPTGYFTEGPSGVKGVPLIHLLGLDNLDQQLNPVSGGDGFFDFIDGAETKGGTFQTSDGDIYFTVLQPFGSYIHTHVFPNDPTLANKYAFDSLYTMTKTQAEQYADKNKYLLQGSYKSQSGSTINLNAMNIPPGSVKVTAGGVPLTENVDYTVDYTLGQITILNQGILNSGTPIHVSLENNSTFNVQQKTMMGIHVDHEFTPDFHVGATLLNLHERPLTQKVNYGNDPISNTIWGLNLAYTKDARWISKMLSKLPGTTPNTPSKVNYNAEVAEFLPGHSRTVGKSGTSYVDDFEGAQSTIDLTNVQSWHLASTPQGQPDLFPEASPNTGLAFGKNRALLAWYIIDPSIFYDIRGTNRPKNITKDEISRNSTRQVLENEVFPNKDIPNGTPTNIPVFNLAFFPSQRGEYNYDVYPGPYSAGMLANGDLANPQSRWGGIMRAMQTTDFQAANIQYIEFWMMDPFTGDKNNPGNLYIDLGDVSEDILPDGRMSDESGLPTSAAGGNVDTTLWGVVPQQQSLVQSFSNIAGSRKYQDVGYDGLNDKAEREFFQNSFLDLIKQRFGTADSAYIKAYNDPSADDYHYYRGTDYDNNPLYSSITERYSRYNGPEGNSTPNFPEPEPYSTVATNLPDKEDLNNDNTLSESERYYQYKIVLNPADMKVGQDYITDIRNAANIHLPNGKTTSVNWYEFKIPINTPNKVVGNISGFQSIRFMRVFMRGFAKPIVCRFATFELVRGDWRTYDQSLLSPGEYLTNNAADKTQFVVSTVNLEENSNRSPIPYVIPPGIKREVNYGTTNYVRLNEQSLQFTVGNLQDGDSRAAYKNVSFDFRQYKDLKMFVHGEKLYSNENIKDGDLTVFLRIGSDFTQNYYEYEIPLHLTPWYTSSADPNAIWPADNDMDVNLAKLVQVKLDRDAAMRGNNSGVSLTTPYSESDGTSTITVVGNPNLGDITGIMIGVRNPRQLGNASGDDGQPKSAIVWFDELRLTGFNNSPGWAATGRLEANLSDLGRFSASGSFRSAGFGSLDQSLNQISQNNVSNYALSTDLDLGKFFSKKTGLVIPLHVDYGKAFIVPKYDPLNPDVLLKNDINSYATKAEQDSIRNMAIDYTRTTSFSLMNVHKERTSGGRKRKKPELYDPENFNASFSYSQVLHHNTDIAMNKVKTYQGGFGYNFDTRPKNIEPFKKAKKMNSPWLRWLKDFNFNLVPSVISFRTDMNRLFNSMLYRNKSGADIITYPTYMRQWTWDRNYTLKYNLTQSLGVEYTAGANAYIKEPEVYPDKNTAAWAEYKREIWNQIESMGTLQNFNHSLQVNYNFPLSKIPLTDWINLMGSYQVQYNWNASPTSVQSSFGNTAENARNIQLNGGVDFNQLYNKIPFLKRMNRNGGSQSHRPFTRRFGPGAVPQRKGSRKKEKKSKKKINPVESTLFRILMMLQNGNFVFQKSNGIQMSGFKPVPDFMGVNLAQDAPGFGFVFGSQKDIRNEAAQNGWITQDTTLNQPYITKLTEQLSYKLNGNILNAITINIDGNRIYSQNYTSYFRFNAEENAFVNYSPQEAGSFSISYPFIKTSFDRTNAENVSRAFEQFKADRLIIANRLAQHDPHWSGKYVYDSLAGQMFPAGYSSTQQQVMYYAFLAAYSGKSASGINIGRTFPALPFPNWRVSFNGLTHIPAIRKVFRSFNMNFGYSSILSINAWATNVSYDPNNPGALYPGTNNIVNRIDLGTVSFVEEYNPLIGIDFTMLNSLGGRVEYKKSRNIVLSFANDQITEVDGNELDVGLSYHVKGLKLAIKNFTGRPTRKYNTDLNLKLDIGVQDNKTILRQIDQADNQISAGSRQYTLNFAANYLLSQNLQLQAYFNWNENNPYVSSQYLNSTTSGGLTLRFLIGQ